MSRSYKKNPVWTDRTNGAKYWKKLANKKVRKNKDNFSKGKKYKRIYCSYDIHDYIFRWSKHQGLNDFNNRFFFNGGWIKLYNYKNEKEFLNKYWEKYCYRK